VTGAAAWGSFFGAEAAAAAALAGLIFVGVSINLAKVLAYPGVPERALESLLLLLGVLVISSVALAPNVPNRTLGYIFALIGAAVWITSTAFHVRLRVQHPEYPRVWFWRRVVLSQCATVPMWVAGVLLVLGDSGGMYWLVAGCAASFVVAMFSAWVLLVEIMR
jgi:modulator of FtsH protease